MSPAAVNCCRHNRLVLAPASRATSEALGVWLAQRKNQAPLFLVRVQYRRVSLDVTTSTAVMAPGSIPRNRTNVTHQSLMRKAGQSGRLTRATGRLQALRAPGPNIKLTTRRLRFYTPSTPPQGEILQRPQRDLSFEPLPGV
jgi:hypothetical protein